MKIVAASVCLVFCGMLAIANYLNLSGTEFGGGTLTGPLLNIEGFGAALFIMCGLTIIKFKHLTMYLSLLAGILCLPLYLYLIWPGSISWLSSSPSSAISPPFIFNNWAIVGWAAVILAVIVQWWPRSGSSEPL